MKKAEYIVLVVAIVFGVFHLPEKASACTIVWNAVILLPDESKDPQTMKVDEILALKKTDLKQLIGHKPGFREKMAFDEMRHELRRDLRKKKLDGDQEIDVRARLEEITKGFNATGFFLGLILNVYGLIGVYIFSKDKNMIRWAWRGFIVFVMSVFIIGGILAFASLPG